MTYEEISDIKQTVYAITFIHRKAPGIIKWKKSNIFVRGVGYLHYIMMFTDIASAGTVAAQMKLQYSAEGSI
jgi:hypothetical protein